MKNFELYIIEQAINNHRNMGRNDLADILVNYVAQTVLIASEERELQAMIDNNMSEQSLSIKRGNIKAAKRSIPALKAEYEREIEASGLHIDLNKIP